MGRQTGKRRRFGAVFLAMCLLAGCLFGAAAGSCRMAEAASGPPAVADTGIPAFLRQWLELAREQEGKLTGEGEAQIPASRFLVSGSGELEQRLLSAAGQSEDEAVFYMIGRNYVPSGTALKAYFGNAAEYSHTLEDTARAGADRYYLSRFHVTWKDGAEGDENLEGLPDTGEGKRWWQPGDRAARSIHGQIYTFRCIDQDYKGDLALFLCESVIPASTGSSYRWERKEDGTYEYVFYPGPLVCFGEDGEYRNSRIRAWLKEAEGQYADYVKVDTGVDTFFTGATQEGSFRQLDAADLTAVPAQDQQMTDQLFLLSLEEALEYRQYLWQFGEETGENENPETQIGNFCRGYWLRTAYGADSSKTPEAAYVVDLVSGSIHPQAAKAEGEDGGDPELAVTVPFGVRPAFALRQQN